MQRTPVLVVLLLAALTSGGGCGRSPDPALTGFGEVAEQKLTSQQAAQRDQALAARDDLAAQLSGRLLETLATQGPAAAIAVCAEEAPRIAAEVSDKHGISIGRTSFRLRNPQNKPPAWATDLVRRRVVEPVFLTDGQRLAALLPIRLQAACLTCHGPAEDIAPEVRQALAANYPQDRARDFREGALRGWFWVEVPAP
ncbi:MAG: DUF3365 domain-containing protein [Pirellulaceae bacterium]|jgi:hypothetical protein|nr:DUF3365 domain-containing protein [Pirellulaceae bacterium]